MSARRSGWWAFGTAVASTALTTGSLLTAGPLLPAANAAEAPAVLAFLPTP